MSDQLAKISALFQEFAKNEKRLHARILATEDALKSLGVTQDYLSLRYHHHILERQVRDEDLMGPKDASEIWQDEDNQGLHPSPPEGL